MTYLVEKTAELGGFAKNIHASIDGNNVQEYLSNIIEKANNNENLKIFLESEIDTIEGFVGNFETKLKSSGNNENEKNSLEHGIVVVATGGEQYQPTEYLYSKDPRVVTQIDFEKMLFENKLDEKVNKIVMIQCIGSRNDEKPYCSRVCCVEAIKNSIILKDLYPEKEVIVLFRDIRTYGLKEKYYREARSKGVMFLRFDEKLPPELVKEGENLVIQIDSPNIGKVDLDLDLLVLSAGIHPPYESNKKLAPMLKVPLNDDKFFLEAHVKLRPVDFATAGVFVCGLAHSPRSIDESIMQANAVVSRASTYLSKDEIESEGIIATVDISKCSGCGLCIETCAYNAITMDEEKMVIEINSGLCKGCGACVSSCRGLAIDLLGYTDEELYLVINEIN